MHSSSLALSTSIRSQDFPGMSVVAVLGHKLPNNRFVQNWTACVSIIRVSLTAGKSSFNKTEQWLSLPDWMRPEAGIFNPQDTSVVEQMKFLLDKCHTMLCADIIIEEFSKYGSPPEWVWLFSRTAVAKRADKCGSWAGIYISK